MTPRTFARKLETVFESHANPEQAGQMEAYMKHHARFYGVKTPERKAIIKEHLKSFALPQGDDLKAVCRYCFREEARREMQYAVNDLLQKAMRQLDASFLDLVEELIPMQCWWDTVDFLSPKIAGGLLLRFPEQLESYPDQWIKSDDFWFQRAAIIFQLNYKVKTDSERLFSYIAQRSDSQEFFVQKGAGWALRQYARVSPDEVRSFIQQHDLPALTVREGGKYL